MKNAPALNTTVDFDYPIKRGETNIDSITLRKPLSGELRGVNIADLLQMDVSALIRITPRISQPSLTEHEVANLDPADMFQIGSAVSSFLLPRAMKTQFYQAE